MTERDPRHVIVLDRWLEEYPDHWPVSVMVDTLEEARAEDAYGGGNPAPVPRRAYVTHLVERTRLLDESTGRIETGTIFRLQRGEDRPVEGRRASDG